MKPFWKPQPLSRAEIELVEALGRAHHESTFRNNPSTLAVCLAAQGSGDLLQSFVAALSTLGGKHGPILETFDWIEHSFSFPEMAVKNFFKLHPAGKLPGWGHGFCKGAIDPLWSPVATVLASQFEMTWHRMEQTTEALHGMGKMIYPNPSAFTAVTARVIGMPRAIAPMLLVMSRLGAWAELFLNETTRKET